MWKILNVSLLHRTLLFYGIRVLCDVIDGASSSSSSMVKTVKNPFEWSLGVGAEREQPESQNVRMVLFD